MGSPLFQEIFGEIFRAGGTGFAPWYLGSHKHVTEQSLSSKVGSETESKDRLYNIVVFL